MKTVSVPRYLAETGNVLPKNEPVIFSWEGLGQTQKRSLAPKMLQPLGTYTPTQNKLMYRKMSKMRDSSSEILLLPALLLLVGMLSQQNLQIELEVYTLL